jgi:hypothetical protein
MSRQRRRFFPNFDSLEGRVVPAGNVTASFSNHLLSITGDNEPNGISLTNNGDGSFTLDTTDGNTTFNGSPDPLTVTPTALFKVTINMRGGDDTLDILGGGVTIRGNSSIKLGEGVDTLTVDGVFARNGAKIDGEAGDDLITVTNSGFDNRASILGGAGVDSITLDNVFFGEDAKVDGGIHDDVIDITNGRFHGEDARVNGGAGVDAITILDSRFGEDARVDTGTSDDTLVIDNTVTGEDFELLTGNGVDLVAITHSRFDENSTFKLGSGDDEIQLGGNFFNKKAAFDSGAGFDTFTHDGANIWAKKHKVKSFELFQLGVVTPPIDSVVAGDDAASIVPLGSITFDVVGNDVAPDGASLDLTTLTIVSPPAGGTAVANADGTISYLNTSGVTGTDTLTYTIMDDLGNLSNEATVTVTISNEGDLTANPDSAIVDEGGSVIVNVALNDTTPAGTTLDLTSIVITAPPVNGTAVANGDGTITYTHNSTETTSDSFEYTVTNTNGDTSSPGMVNITVTPVNDGPVALNDGPFSVTIGSGAIFNVLANDIDFDGTLHVGSIVILTGPTEGTATVLFDGSIQYTSNSGSLATLDSFTYTVSDDQGLVSNDAAVIINLISVG